MILLTSELRKLVDDGVILFDGDIQIGQNSIDVHFGDRFQMEEIIPRGVVNPKSGIFPTMRDFKDTIQLLPGGFCLAGTAEVFHIPEDLVMKFTLTSTLARCGLNQMLAITANPGFKGHLTLELVNTLARHATVLSSGEVCGQVEFYRTDGFIPEHYRYSRTGRYQNDSGADAPKESR